MSKLQKYFIWALFLASLIPFGLGNTVWYRIDSVMENPISDKNNSRVQAEQYALNSGIEYTNPLFVYLEMPELNRNNLLSIVNFTQKLQSFLDEKGIEAEVASLSSRTDYGPDSIGKFISSEAILDPEFNSEEWIEVILENRSVKGSMIGRYGEDDYSVITIFPAQRISEIELAKNFLVFANGWQDYESPMRFPDDLGKWWSDVKVWVSLNTDPEIELHQSSNNFEIDGVSVHSQISVDPSGWSFNRPIIDIKSRATSILPIVGMLVVCLFFFWILLGSWKQAAVAVSIIGLDFYYGRGIIGVCDRFLFDISSDTFTIIAFFTIIVSSVSINLYHFEAFNTTHLNGNCPDARYWRRWEDARKSISVTRLIVVVSVIDFLWTMTLKNCDGSRSVFQIGIVAAFGIFVSWLMSHFLPFLYEVFGGKNENVQENQSVISRWFFKKASGFVWVVQKWAAWEHSWKVGVVVFYVVIVSAVGLYPYFINLDNNPTEFLDNTMSERITKNLNLPGRPGASLYAPVIHVDLLDSEALDQLRLYLEEVSKFSRTTYSPLYDFMVVLRDYGYNSGDSIGEVLWREAVRSLRDEDVKITYQSIAEERRLIIQDIWRMMWDNDSALLKHFIPSPYNNSLNNIVLMITSSEESTPEIRDFRDRFVKAGENSDLIKVYPASKLSQWPDNDDYVTKGNLQYNFLSQLVVAIFCFVYFLVIRKDRAENSLKSGILVSIPFFWALATMYLIMMIFQVPLDIASSAISSMAVSIAVDFPLMIIDRFRLVCRNFKSFEKSIVSKEMNEIGVAVLFDSIANSFLLSGLLFVGIVPIVRLGFLEELVILACISGTMFLVFPFLRWIR